MAYKLTNRIRLIFSLTLLIMILMRLVWIQLRSYEIVIKADVYSILSSLDHCDAMPSLDQGLLQELRPGVILPALKLYFQTACSDGVFDPSRLVRMNEWVLVGSIVLCTLLLRFLSSSWFVPMIGAATLLSRGRLISASGDISANSLMTLFICFWFASGIHFFRTGSKASMVSGALAILIGGFIGPSSFFLALSMPSLLILGYFARSYLVRSVLLRFREEKRKFRRLMKKKKTRESEGGVLGAFSNFVSEKLIGSTVIVSPNHADRSTYTEGGVFQTIRIPFALWAYHRRRWLKISLFWFGAMLVSALFTLLMIQFQNEGFLSHLNSAANSWRTGQGVGFNWFGIYSSFVAALDLHYVLSLAIILLCAFQGPAGGFIGFFEASWLLIFSFFFLAIGLLFLNGFDHLLGFSFFNEDVANIINWFEPVILSLAIAGIVNIFKTIKVRFQ